MYRALSDEVDRLLRGVLQDRGLPHDDLGIEDPPDDVDAVLASSVAFRLAAELGETPPAVAATLAEEIDISDTIYVENITPIGPYLNFQPTQAYYTETLQEAADEQYGELESTGESVVVEHTSANPTGPVHVGRARNPIVGDAIARLLDLAGNDVERHYYVNDAGRQVALFTWAYETFSEDDLPEPDREKPDYDLVRYYRKGNAYLEDADPATVEKAEEEISAIMHGLEIGDEEAIERVHSVVDRVLAGMTETLDRLPAAFDEFVHETQFMRDGSTDAVVEQLQSTAYAEQEDGGWQLRLEEWDIEKPFVFLRSDGTSLYTTRDVAHHEWKFEHFDRAVTVLGEGHGLQASQLRATLEILGNDTDRLDQVLYGWVNLPGGATMSTRAGTGIDMDDLLDEAIRRARHEVEKRLDERIRADDLTEDDIDRIAHQVGIGAVRYDIVAKQANKSITFEWDRALDFEAQSAPYLQYVHARCCGIMDEAGCDPPSEPNAGILDHPMEVELLETIARFPGVVEEAAEDLAPHVVATYARQLAEVFNGFYRECSVTGTDVPSERRQARLALVSGSRNTMANALWLLGVEAPRSM